jgi:glycosyltransferase involved in cell wall biosynthesis
MISIVIPALNEEKFLPNLLESLATQTNRDFEVVVVDGSSKDKTVEIARSFAPKLPKLKVIVSPKASLPLQRNLGAKETTGEWLLFIDADSTLFPHCIERLYEYISRSRPAFFTTWMRPDSDIPGDAMIALLGNLMLQFAYVLHRPMAPGPLAVIRRDVFDEVGGYNESHAFHEDVEISQRLSKHKIPFSIIPETLYIWSLRRLRKQGTLRVVQQYLLSAVPVLIQMPMKYMPGYTMGGQLYTKKKKAIKKSMLKQYEAKLKNLMKEIFE